MSELPIHPVERAAKILGGYQAMAIRLGVTRSAVHQWTAAGRAVPPEHCPAIEQFTQGEVRCEELNDRVDWGYLRKSEPELADQVPQPEGDGACVEG